MVWISFIFYFSFLPSSMPYTFAFPTPLSSISFPRYPGPSCRTCSVSASSTLIPALMISSPFHSSIILDDFSVDVFCTPRPATTTTSLALRASSRRPSIPTLEHRISNGFAPQEHAILVHTWAWQFLGLSNSNYPDSYTNELYLYTVSKAI